MKQYMRLDRQLHYVHYETMTVAHSEWVCGGNSSE